MRLRFAEPVRFRFLVGMLSGSGNSGMELLLAGLKFINAFTETCPDLQTKFYVQAELKQAGFKPAAILKVRYTTWKTSSIRLFKNINVAIVVSLEYIQQITTVELGFRRDIQMAKEFYKCGIAQETTRRSGPRSQVAQGESSHVGKENSREYIPLSTDGS